MIRRLICRVLGHQPGARYRYNGHPSMYRMEDEHGVWIYVCNRCGGDI
jgi:hypothetical protein